MARRTALDVPGHNANQLRGIIAQTLTKRFHIIDHMEAVSFIQCRVAPATKLALRAAAKEQQISESALIKRMLHVLLHSAAPASPLSIAETERSDRRARLYVRLTAGDQTLLRERAHARSLPAATYASVLLRAHLRGLVPIPKEELRAFRQAITELTIIGRNLNQLARSAHQGSGQGATRADLMALLRACEALRDHFRSVLRVNTQSWTSGDATNRTP